MSESFPTAEELHHLTDAELGAADARDDLLLLRVETTPEQDAAAWVHGRPERSGPVNIVPYDPTWPEDYAVEAQRVRDILGEHVVTLAHVGSTSVPGLAAKPIIDMQLTVADSTDEASYVAELEAAGYRLVVREPFWHEHRLLKGPAGAAEINLHVYTAGNSEAERVLVFCDWLRAHDADRDLYVQTKLGLAPQQWAHLQDYTVSKDSVIDDIIHRAVAARRAARQAVRDARASSG